MTIPEIQIYDAQTGEITRRPMTDDEIAAIQEFAQNNPNPTGETTE